MVVKNVQGVAVDYPQNGRGGLRVGVRRGGGMAHAAPTGEHRQCKRGAEDSWRAPQLVGDGGASGRGHDRPA